MWRDANIINTTVKKYQGWATAGLYSILFLCLHGWTWRAGRSMDFTGVLERLDEPDAWSLLAETIGYFPVAFAGFDMIYSLFGTDAAAWAISHYTVFGICVFLLYHWARSYSELLHIYDPRWVAGLAGLLFIINPHQSEVIVWRSTIHYLLCAALCFGSLWAWTLYLNRRSPAHVIVCILCLVAGIFTKEYAYVIPLVMLVQAIVYVAIRAPVRPRNIFIIPILLTVGLGAYLWMTYSGGGAGSVNREISELSGTSLVDIIRNYLLYIPRLLLFIRYWEIRPTQEYISSMQHHPEWVIIGFILLIGVMIYLYYRPQASRRDRAAIGMWVMYSLFLGPSIFLYFYVLQLASSDRYSFLASGPLAILLGLWFSKRPSWRSQLLLPAFITISLLTTVIVNRSWYQSERVMTGLLSDFRWEEAPHVWILNSPSNYKGVYMFLSAKRVGYMHDKFKYLTDKEIAGSIHQVSSYNMLRPDDRSEVRVLGARSLELELQQWGHWWWYGSMGASDYETEELSVDYSGRKFRLDMKVIPPGSVFIYQDGDRWREVPMNTDGTEFIQN